MQLIKGVVCPICRKAAQLSHGSPFREFDAMDLHEDCPNKECKVFYETLNAQFVSYEKGHINEAELKTWLDSFRVRSANSEG
jgi:NADPH-dependent 7-cyano-7-deazaguanine reductase QueF